MSGDETEWGRYELMGKFVDLVEWATGSWSYDLEVRLTARGGALSVRLGDVPPGEEWLWAGWRVEAVELQLPMRIEVFRSARFVWWGEAPTLQPPFGRDFLPLRSVPGGLYHADTLAAGPLHMGGTERFMIRALPEVSAARAKELLGAGPPPKVRIRFRGLTRVHGGSTGR